MIKKHPPAARLLFSRVETAEITGLSVATLIRLEALGKLTPVKPSGTPQSKTYYTAANVQRLASADTEAA